MLELSIREETWDEIWPEASGLAAMHSEEVDSGVEPRRVFAPDVDGMRVLNAQGWLRLLGARLGPRLIGYFTWQLNYDLESKGLLVAAQGAWFVLPGYPRVAFGMYEESIRMLRGLGVQCIYPHHRLQGRGAHLGRFFERQGAKPIQTTYSLWIGDFPNG